jgi:hypothetical protein
MNTEKFMKVLLVIALILIAIALSGDVLHSLVELMFDSGL